MKIYYTARELAEMKLSGLPETESAMIRRAKRDGWKSRARRGSGGGNEYHFGSLPDISQKSLIEHLVGTDAIEALQNSASLIEMKNDRRRAKFQEDELATARMIIVARFEKFRQATGTPVLSAEHSFILFYATEGQLKGSTFIPEWVRDVYPDFSVQSLRRWRTLYKQIKSLKPKYGNRKGTGVIERGEDGLIRDYIAALLIKQEHLNAGHIRDLCRNKFGNTVMVKDLKSGAEKEVPLPKIRAFERHIVAWKTENADIFEKLTNPDSHKNRKQLALGNASAGIVRLNQRWEIDASPVDALCEDGRYSLYAIIDVWSRRVMFSVSKTPRTEASLLLIRKAVMEWGVPETIKTDNGSDFTSKRFMTSLLHLGIEQDICTAYTPEQKPHVERVIQTIQHGLMPLLPGYVGHSVSDAQQIRAKKTFAARLGENDEKSFAVSMSHEQLQEYMDRWANDKYAHNPHSGLNGMTPIARAASWSLPIKKIGNVRALDLMLAPMAGGDGFRTIGKKGLRINNGHFYGPGIELYVGKRVMVRHDPEDMGRVYVFTENHEFICEATNIDRLGADPARAASEAKARQKQMVTEGTKELRRAARKITPELISEQYLSQAARDAQKITAFPKQSEEYTSPALEEAARAYDKTPLEREQSADEAAQMEAFVADFNRQHSQPEPQSDEDRWWAKIQRLLLMEATAQPLTAEEETWLRWAETMPWYVTRRDFEAMKNGQ